MKKQFAAFYRPSDDEFKRLWDEGWFVLDANVLLNLYRYQEEGRRGFLQVLEALAPRIWVPHQAMLEYHLNREKVIGDQLRRFREVRKVASFQALEERVRQCNEPKRPLIDPAGFLAAVRRHYEDFEQHVTAAENNQITIESDESNDPVRTALNELLADKVGAEFTQAELDALYEEGERRYKIKTPPGYADSQKKGESEHQLGRRIYKRRFGDLILWKQILNWARENKIENVVFVTDERGSDWWQIVKEQDEPGKIIGPRPELVTEIREEAGVSLFYMYQPDDRFMKRAANALSLVIASSSIQEVREVVELELQRDTSVHDDRMSLVNIVGEEGNRRDALLYCGHCGESGIALHFYEGDGIPKLQDVLGVFHFWNCPALEATSLVLIMLSGPSREPAILKWARPESRNAS
jgi:PIN like domain